MRWVPVKAGAGSFGATFDHAETTVTMFETDKEPDFGANVTIFVDPPTQSPVTGCPVTFAPVTFSFVLDDNRMCHISTDPLCTRTKDSFGISIRLHTQACFLWTCIFTLKSTV